MYEPHVRNGMHYLFMIYLTHSKPYYDSKEVETYIKCHRLFLGIVNNTCLEMVITLIA